MCMGCGSVVWRDGIYMMTHLPFSAQGLFFLSGAWISGSFFSFSSTYSRIAAMLFDNGHRSIEAWYFMFSICFFSASRSMVARILGSIAPVNDCSHTFSFTDIWFPLLKSKQQSLYQLAQLCYCSCCCCCCFCCWYRYCYYDKRLVISVISVECWCHTPPRPLVEIHSNMNLYFSEPSKIRTKAPSMSITFFFLRIVTATARMRWNQTVSKIIFLPIQKWDGDLQIPT